MEEMYHSSSVSLILLGLLQRDSNGGVHHFQTCKVEMTIGGDFASTIGKYPARAVKILLQGGTQKIFSVALKWRGNKKELNPNLT